MALGQIHISQVINHFVNVIIIVCLTSCFTCLDYASLFMLKPWSDLRVKRSRIKHFLTQMHFWHASKATYSTAFNTARLIRSLINNRITCLTESNPVKQEVSHTAIFPFTKWLFCAQMFNNTRQMSFSFLTYLSFLLSLAASAFSCSFNFAANFLSLLQVVYKLLRSNTLTMSSSLKTNFWILPEMIAGTLPDSFPFSKRIKVGSWRVRAEVLMWYFVPTSGYLPTSILPKTLIYSIKRS